MLQNLKNFFIAFLTGLVVFGLCAAWILSAIKHDDNDNTDNKSKVPENNKHSISSTDGNSEKINDNEDYEIQEAENADSAEENE